MKPEAHRENCRSCRHYREGEANPTCVAFPKGIPWRIYHDGFDHRDPWAGDGGVRYAPRDQ